MSGMFLIALALSNPKIEIMTRLSSPVKKLSGFESNGIATSGDIEGDKVRQTVHGYRGNRKRKCIRPLFRWLSSSHLQTLEISLFSEKSHLFFAFLLENYFGRDNSFGWVRYAS